MTFTSDSQYLVKGMNEWVFGWMSRGWKKKEGQLLNVELWMDAVEAVRGHQLNWKWVRGHVGHPQNEYANFLATTAAKQQTKSDGIIASGFDEWLVAERDAGRVTGTPEVFPTSDGFRAQRPYPVVTRPATVSD